MNTTPLPKTEDNEATPSERTLPERTPVPEPSESPGVTPGVAGDTPPPRGTCSTEEEDVPASPPLPERTLSEATPPERTLPERTPNVIVATPTTEPKIEYEEELLLKWDDHHKSFFEAAEDLCHQEQFIDVTLSCGEHNFPAHKLVLSVCSPYFRVSSVN